MTVFDDWDIEPEQEEFKCPLCGCDRYKLVSTETDKPRYKTTKKKSGLTTVSKVKRTDILVSKDFAECLNCSNKTQLNKSEEVIPKETKKEVAERMAKTKFDGHFLDPGAV